MHEPRVLIVARGLWFLFWASLCGVLAGVELPADLLIQLKSDRFQEREAAEQQLIEWSRKRPNDATEPLYRHYQSADDPEQRERCLAVLRVIVGDLYFADGKGFVGIRMRDDEVLFPGKNGEKSKVVRVIDVLPGLAADKAGIMVNDCITGLNGRGWAKGIPTKIFEESIKGAKPGTQVTLNVIREGKISDIAVVLGRRPLMADDPRLGRFPEQQEAAEQAAKEAYIQRWLKMRNKAK